MIVCLSVFVKDAKASLIKAMVLISKLEFLNIDVEAPIKAADIGAAVCRTPDPLWEALKLSVGADFGWRRLHAQNTVPSRKSVSRVTSPITNSQIGRFLETSGF